MIKIKVYGNNFKNKYFLEASNGELRITDYDRFNPRTTTLTQVNSIVAKEDRIIINCFDDVSDSEIEDEMQYSYRTLLDTEELAEVSEKEVNSYVKDKTSSNAKEIAEEVGCNFIQS